jgi:hypothetical protein
MADLNELNPNIDDADSEQSGLRVADDKIYRLTRRLQETRGSAQASWQPEQADGSGRFYHSGLPQGKSVKVVSRVPLRARQPRAIAINR